MKDGYCLAMKKWEETKVLKKGGRIEFVLDGEHLEREEPLIFVRDCALLNVTIQVELTNVELKTQVTLPLIYEEKELTIATVCSFTIEATFSSKRRKQSIQASLQRNGKFTEAVLIPDDVNPLHLPLLPLLSAN
ncbi:hypothetical protein QOT17_013836 [Balamuthia mandrillaris]